MERTGRSCIVYVIRHGETDWNVAGKLQGQADTELNARGRRQAKSAAEYFQRNSHRPIAAVYTSDLLRTLVTAETIAAEIAAPLLLDAQLRETHFGEWQGSRWEDIERDRKAEISQWKLDPDFCIPSGESRRMRFGRVATALHRIALNHLGQHIVVVTHSGVLDDIGRLLGRVPWGTPTGLKKVNASISICEFVSAVAPTPLELHTFRDPSERPVGDWRLLEWGFTDHLQLEHDGPAAIGHEARPVDSESHPLGASLGHISTSAAPTIDAVSNSPHEGGVHLIERSTPPVFDAAVDDAEQNVSGV